jgi:phage shock protein PspC (stress-responsive transcriptional regulator)
MSEHTLNPPSIKRLERPEKGKVIAGVSAGLGDYFDLTPAVFRLGFVVLTLLGGAGILVYIAAALIIPKHGEERSMAEDILANRREHPGRLVALGLIAVAVLSLLAHADTWPTAGTAWVLVIVAGLIFLWTRKGRGIVVGVVTTLAVLLAVGVAAVVAAFAWFDVSFHDGVGEHTYAPVAAPAGPYDLGIGNLKLDLTSLPAGTETVKTHLGIGELHIVVPQDAQVDAHVAAGSIDALGRHDDGTDAHLIVGSGSLHVDADVGAGHIEIVRAP